MTVNRSVAGTLRKFFGDALVRRLLGPGLWALVIKVASAGLSYLMLVALARLMTADQYGEFGVMLNLAIVLSTVVAIGLPTAVMRFWPSHLAANNTALAKGFHTSAQRLLVATSAVLLVIGTFASLFVDLSAVFSSRYSALIVTGLAGVFAFGDYYANALRAQNRVLWSMIPRDIVWRILVPAVAAWVFWITGQLSGLLALICCLAIMALVALSQAYVSHHTANRITGIVVAEKDWKQWKKPLIPLASASILYAMVQQLDVVVVGSLVGSAEAGAYFAAQKTASLLGLVMIAGGLVAAPMMSAAFQSGQKVELQRLCKMLSLAIALTTFAGFVVLLMIGRPLLAIFDASYQNAYVILLVLAIGYGIDALAGPTAYLMQMTSLEGTYLRIMAIVYACVLALQFAFVPKYGAIAAALATALGTCLWNALAIYHLRKSIGVDSSILSFFLPAKAQQP